VALRSTTGRRVAVGLLAAATAILVAAPSAGARGTTVKVDDDFFSPTNLSVSAGTKVSFNWVGNDKHNVVKKSGPGGSFSSTVTDDQGVQFKHKFKKAGTYKLICTVHEGMKMKVKVN
jgi:plastocyanin